MGLKEEFLEGNRRKYTATFKVPDANGVLTNPTAVTFYRRKVGAGAAAESFLFGSSAVTNPSTGVFTLELDYPDDGRYVVGVEGTGACTAYDEIEVNVTNAKARP